MRESWARGRFLVPQVMPTQQVSFSSRESSMLAATPNLLEWVLNCHDFTTVGILGMVFYSVFAGAPIIIVGFLGIIIQDRIPRVFSFSDYVHRVWSCLRKTPKLAIYEASHLV